MNHKVLAAYRELCTGCRQCELACAEFHMGRRDAAYARIRVTTFEDRKTAFPTICMHCKIAKCELACPTRALHRQPQLRDVVVLDQSRCVRCMECVHACPFAAIWLSPAPEILKCDLCGGDPACVKVCPERPSLRPPHWPDGKVSCLQYLDPEQVTLFGRLKTAVLR
jgi:Fe-S-cluster-containing hydrogenase component 2